MFKFSKRSLNNLEGVHKDLQAIAHEAIKITPIDFVVIEGLRSVSRQKKLFESGASQTMRSRHLTGHAIDIAAWVDGSIRWDWPLYDGLAVAMKRAASDLGVPLDWGGDWVTFKDGPHYQLPWYAYPAKDKK